MPAWPTPSAALPPEVQHQILSHLASQVSPSPSDSQSLTPPALAFPAQAALASFALVSRAARDLALPYLYRAPFLRGLHQIERLRRTLVGEKEEGRLARLVRQLDFSAVPHRWDQRAIDVMAFVKRCSALTYLNLDFCSITDTHMAIVFLHTPLPRTLHTLIVSTNNITSNTFDVLFQFSFLSPEDLKMTSTPNNFPLDGSVSTLRVLDLGHTSVNDSGVTALLCTPCLAGLEELCLAGCEDVSDACVPLMARALEGSPENVGGKIVLESKEGEEIALGEVGREEGKEEDRAKVYPRLKRLDLTDCYGLLAADELGDRWEDEDEDEEE